MTKDEVIALARQAEGEEQQHGMWRMHVEDLERFAALVAAHERERILEMCKEGWWDGEGIRYHLEQQDAIRSRT